MTSTVGREGTSRSVATPMLNRSLGSGVTGSPPAFGAVQSRFKSGLPSYRSVRTAWEHAFVRISFTEEAARDAIARATNWTEALRILGMCHSGGNPTTLKKYARRWEISTEHFDPA